MRAKSRQTITYRLHAQRAMLIPSIMLRRGYLEKVHLAQIKSEKDAILSHIGRLHPGVREEYLRHKQRLRIANDHLDTVEAQYRRRGTTADESLRTWVKLRLNMIVSDSDRIKAGKRAEYLQTRDAALTDRIPKKAIGL